jgi:hypothetical protein
VLSSAIRETGASGRQLTLLTGHTKGVASLRKGELEYMLIRRINGTDDQGPWPLNETTPLSGKPHRPHPLVLNMMGARTHTHTHAHAHAHAHTHARTHTRARTHTHTHCHTRARARTRTHTHTHMHHPRPSCALTHTHTHTQTVTVGLLVGSIDVVDPDRVALARSLDSPPRIVYQTGGVAPTTPIGSPIAELPHNVVMLSLFNAPKGLVGTPTADMTAVVVVRLQNIATDASSPTVPVNLTAVLGKAVGESDTIRWVL